MGNILQDMISMLTRKKSVIPKADDYIAIARYAGTQERLKQHPKLNSELTTLADLKKFTCSNSVNIGSDQTIIGTKTFSRIVIVSEDGTKWEQTISNDGVTQYNKIS